MAARFDRDTAKEVIATTGQFEASVNIEGRVSRLRLTPPQLSTVLSSLYCPPPHDADTASGADNLRGRLRSILTTQRGRPAVLLELLAIIYGYTGSAITTLCTQCLVLDPLTGRFHAHRPPR